MLFISTKLKINKLESYKGKPLNFILKKQTNPKANTFK